MNGYLTGRQNNINNSHAQDDFDAGVYFDDIDEEPSLSQNSQPVVALSAPAAASVSVAAISEPVAAASKPLPASGTANQFRTGKSIVFAYKKTEHGYISEPGKGITVVPFGI